MRIDLLASHARRRPAYFENRLVGFHRPDYDDIGFRYNDSVDLSQVVGMSHCQYAGLTWGELVGDETAGRPPGLKRLDCCLQELADNPSYYLTRDVKKDWVFFKAGNEYFVANGHHRTVVGRLVLELNRLPTTVYGAQVMEVDPANWLQAQHEGPRAARGRNWRVPEKLVFDVGCDYGRVWP